MANHKNTLTPQQAIARKQWIDQWEELRVWAMRCTIRYCRLRLAQYGQAQWLDVRDDSLGEAYRAIISNPELTARKAISQAVDKITYDLSRLHSIQCQNEAIGEMPEHSTAYVESEGNVQNLIGVLPKRLRPLATLLSAGIVESVDLVEYLNCSDSLIRRYKRELRTLLGSRFGYLLGDEMEVPVWARLA